MQAEFVAHMIYLTAARIEGRVASVNRPTNCSNDRQGLQRSKGSHRPKRNPKRGQIKKHTECFSCSRIYFDRLLPSCPHCGCAMVRHYNSEELNYFSHGSSADECVEFERRATVS